MRRQLTCVLPLMIACMLLASITLRGGDAHGKESAKIQVVVSILPQAYFVERVGGKRVDVSVMVGSGQSHEAYEPRPKQMAQLGQAEIYFKIGLPFEEVWLPRISRANSNLKVVDTRQGIQLLPMRIMKGNDLVHAGAGHAHGSLDPHIWTSLRLVKIQAENIFTGLVKQDPASESYYHANLDKFQTDLDKLDAQISAKMRNLASRKFIAFHPAWEYFAHDYSLEQIPVEIEGKDPSQKQLAHLIRQARTSGIKVVFVQEQSRQLTAKMVAEAIGGKIVYIDPLASNYLENMRAAADKFAEAMR